MNITSGDAPTPPLRLDLIAEFRVWSEGMGLTELVMRKRNSKFASLTSAELQEVNRQMTAENEAGFAEIADLSAKVAELIVQKLLREARHGT